MGSEALKVAPTQPVTAPAQAQLPRHLGIVLDGNRRWARAHQLSDVSEGHRIGFAKIPTVLSWCDSCGIEVVTLWMLSTDNIKHRSAPELEALYEIDEQVVGELVALAKFQIKAIGTLSLLPTRLALALREAERATSSVDGMQVNLAIGYGGREDLLQAVRSLIEDVRATGNAQVTEERLSAHLATRGQPDPDLIIRTSGELRTSGFLLWQAALAELYFPECDWPDFSEMELRRALHAYAMRKRRFGA